MKLCLKPIALRETISTYIVYLEDDTISYFVVEGDYSHLHNVWPNPFVKNHPDAKKCDELYALIYKDGKVAIKKHTVGEWRDEIQKGNINDKFIICGFMP